MDPRHGAIVLCGGGSERMGRDKASLPFGDETMLQRVVRLVGSVVPAESILCVAGADQPLPALADGVRVVRDRQPDRGPLPALLAGLMNLPAEVEAVFATACDAPLLKPAVVPWLLEQLGDCDAAVPAGAKQLYPLCAAYRASCRDGLAAALRQEVQSLQGLLQSDIVRVRTISCDKMRSVDRDLKSLFNCNTPADYERALLLAGLSA